MHELLIALIVGIAALAASTVAAVVGFGGAAIMLPILVGVFGVRDAIPILTVSQLIGNLSRVWFNKSGISVPVVRWFALGAVPTATLGGIVFATAPVAALTRVLGVFLLVTVAYRHTPWGKRLRIRLRGFLPLGAMSGAISALVGTVGPFMAPFFLAYGLAKGAYIGTEALSTVVMHMTKLSVYGGYALLGTHTALVGVAIGAIMFIGSYVGKQILNRLPKGLFPYLIEAVLSAAGLLFIIRGK
ncbi:MAG: sulfite exporter TauE/SafE family protein [Chloroflexi bacterium]|nr:sulfite exporter TauE/SafE family protein [Chloroflexota bacterium]